MSNTDNYFDPDTGEIDGDRGVPQVEKSGTARVVLIVFFIGFCILAIFGIAYDDMRKRQPAPETQKEEIVFTAPQPRAEPYIVEPVAEMPQKALPEPQAPQIDYEQLRYEQQMMEDAMRRAQEERTALEERMKAPQLVYDEKTNSSLNNIQTAAGDDTQSASLGGTNHGSATLLSGGGGSEENDPNLAFANANFNTNVQTAKATQLQNLDTLIAQGELISATLETAIHSDLPGMVRAITSHDVYSFNGTNMLIPEGSRLIGQYRSGIRQGQSRVFVIWNRMIRPDGASIDLGSIGTDALGRSGLAGDVNSHFVERFGSSVLLSIIDGALGAAVSKVDDEDASAVSVNGSREFSSSAEIALESSINIKPTIHIDQGERIKVFVDKDLDFADVGGAY